MRLSCATCGYALAGLADDASCPECATPVATSLAHALDDPWDAPPLRRALWMLAALNAAGIVVVSLSVAKRIEPMPTLAIGAALFTASSTAWLFLARVTRNRWVGARGVGILGLAIVVLCITGLVLEQYAGRDRSVPVFLSMAFIVMVRSLYVMMAIDEIAIRLNFSRHGVAILLAIVIATSATIASVWAPLMFCGWVCFVGVFAMLAVRARGIARIPRTVPPPNVGLRP